METFLGSGHLPGAPKTWNIELDADWAKKEFTVRIPGAEGGITEWPALMVQTIGVEEAVFRTKGIPDLLTHWWLIARGGDNLLFGMVLARPNPAGTWLTCSLRLKKV